MVASDCLDCASSPPCLFLFSHHFLIEHTLLHFSPLLQVLRMPRRRAAKYITRDNPDPNVIDGVSVMPEWSPHQLLGSPRTCGPDTSLSMSDRDPMEDSMLDDERCPPTSAYSPETFPTTQLTSTPSAFSTQGFMAAAGSIASAVPNPFSTYETRPVSGDLILIPCYRLLM